MQIELEELPDKLAAVFIFIFHSYPRSIAIKSTQVIFKNGNYFVQSVTAKGERHHVKTKSICVTVRIASKHTSMSVLFCKYLQPLC